MKLVRDASSNADAAALIQRKSQSGAMGAAGIPVPEAPRLGALIRAFAAVDRAGDWTVHRSNDTAPNSGVLTASLLREAYAIAGVSSASEWKVLAIGGW